MTRRIFSAFILILAVAVAVVFTWLNPGRIELDLGFQAFDVPVSVAFVATFALGWLFGLLSAGAWMYRRRRARKRREKAERTAAEDLSLPVIDERG